MTNKRPKPEEIVSKLRQVDLEGGCTGQLLSPAGRRACIDHVRSHFKLSERRACRVMGQHRSTQRHVPHGRTDKLDWSLI